MIRAMEVRDIPGALEIEKTLPGRQWTYRAFAESLQQAYTWFTVAETEDGRIAGYCCCERLYEEAEIVNVAVDPRLRRRGIGRELLRHLIEREKEAGTQSIVLEVRAGNEPAICLYEEAGFVRLGVRKNFYEFPVEDAVVMRLALAQG